MLVLTDMWYPGWRAYVDGVEQPIYRVYHAFRGVSVPAGSHTVEFVYQPGMIAWGAGVSLASLAALVVAIRLASGGHRGLPFWGQSPRRRRPLRASGSLGETQPPVATDSWRL